MSNALAIAAARTQRKPLVSGVLTLADDLRAYDNTTTAEVTVQAPAAAERPARSNGVRPVALDEYMAQRGGTR